MQIFKLPQQKKNKKRKRKRKRKRKQSESSSEEDGRPEKVHCLMTFLVHFRIINMCIL